MDSEATKSLALLRDSLIPETVGSVPDTRRASPADRTVEGRSEQMSRATAGRRLRDPLAFVLMLSTFRSIVVAIKAIVLNLLSVASAYGVLVLVFQHG